MPSLFRAHMPLAVLASGFLALVSATQCTSTSGDLPASKQVNDASTRDCATREGCSTTTTGGFPVISTEGGILNVADVTPDHARIEPPDGGPCDADASEDGGACPLPPSICVDEHWLAYFVNPVCSATGSCEWEVRYRSCAWCIERGCRTNITASRREPYRRAHR